MTTETKLVWLNGLHDQPTYNYASRHYLHTNGFFKDTDGSLTDLWNNKKT